jgi:hypothetical protein
MPKYYGINEWRLLRRIIYYSIYNGKGYLLSGNAYFKHQGTAKIFLTKNLLFVIVFSLL